MQQPQKQTNQNAKKQEEPRKAVIFARVSTARQEKEGLSLDEIQLPRMRDYAKEQGLDVVREYAVGETGGGYKDRQKFKEMINYLLEHEDVNDVIAFRVDRITRNFKDAVRMDELRLNNNIRIHCVDEHLVLSKDSKASDLTMWNVKVFTGQEYLNRAKEDGTDTKYNKLERGELPWKAPYGYKNQKHVTMEQRVIPVEPEATIVKEIFEEYATGVYSCRSLAAEMQVRYGGIGQKISHKLVNEVLNNPFYAGEIYDRKSKKSFSHHYIILISPEIFKKCKNVLKEKGELHSRSYGSHPSIYRGFIKCQQCGCDVIPDFKDKKQKNGNVHHYNYYHCSNMQDAHDAQLNITEESISDRIKCHLSKISLSNRQVQALSDKVSAEYAFKLDFYNSERARLAKRRGAIRQHQQNAYDKMIDDVISKEEYNDGNRRYQEELAKIADEEKLLDLRDEKIYTTNRYLQELLKNITEIFGAGRIDEKRKILSILFEVIYLNGKEVNPTIRPQLAPYFL